MLQSLLMSVIPLLTDAEHDFVEWLSPLVHLFFCWMISTTQVSNTINNTSHRVSSSTRWHFAFTAMLSLQWNPCSNCTMFVKATKPLHWLQICPIVYNKGAPPTIPQSYIRVRAVVWACGEWQTDTQTCVTNVHFTSSTTHAKCNEQSQTLITDKKFGSMVTKDQGKSELGWEDEEAADEGRRSKWQTASQAQDHSRPRSRLRSRSRSSRWTLTTVVTTISDWNGNTKLAIMKVIRHWSSYILKCLASVCVRYGLSEH